MLSDRRSLFVAFVGWLVFPATGFTGTPALLLKPSAVFDGATLHQDWAVLVVGDKIAAAGPIAEVHAPPEARVMELTGQTLIPGMIEGHSHLLLHPYNEASWNDQVLAESESFRVARATVHAERTLRAGFTTVRDLGTEGAGYADVGLKQAIEAGVIRGPRMMVATRALVATGSYGPKLSTGVDLPQGAQECSGVANCMQAAREQIGKGADWVKVYADYRLGKDEPSRPTFTEEELSAMVNVAHGAGRLVSAHATTDEGMRRAARAGVDTIEHGDNGTAETFSLMKQRGVALCPTVAAGDAVSQYRGWKKGVDPEPARITDKRASMRAARAAGVTLIFGGDVGVFAHGDNARELELLVHEYGLSPKEALTQATAGNAAAFHLGDRGDIHPGKLADLVSVTRNPLDDISAIRRTLLVIKGGLVIRDDRVAESRETEIK